MEFNNVKNLLAENFNRISAVNRFFETDIDKGYLWNLYLDSFPEGTNPIYRERRVYDCSACRQFIRNIGGAVYIGDDLTVHSIFEFDTPQYDLPACDGRSGRLCYQQTYH